MTDVFTLLVQVGRGPDDDLPDDATGAALLCYASGKTEKIAVDETIQVLKQAGLSPIEVESYGSRAERLSDGQEIDAQEAEMMERALNDNAVVVAQITTFTD
ncbi:MAG: hypothetical protein AAFV19_10325 [Pseudomonadota bacterium]